MRQASAAVLVQRLDVERSAGRRGKMEDHGRGENAGGDDEAGKAHDDLLVCSQEDIIEPIISINA